MAIFRFLVLLGVNKNFFYISKHKIRIFQLKLPLKSHFRQKWTLSELLEGKLNVKIITKKSFLSTQNFFLIFTTKALISRVSRGKIS